MFETFDCIDKSNSRKARSSMDFSLPHSDDLQIEYLGHLFDNTSECYKMFWFQVIVRKIIAGQTSASYEEIIDEMIADAWYMVAEYHLNLGPRDNLELAVKRLDEISDLRPATEKSTLLEYIECCTDAEVLKCKKALTHNVPYRLQAPFLDMKTDDWKVGERQLIERINAYSNLLYQFDSLDGLQTRIHFNETWSEYIIHNQVIIKGWLNYNLVDYLQRRNPNVPGVIDKLNPPQERNLQDIQKYWKMIIDIHPVVEIYGGKQLDTSDISIDHFVPWSYVANDEIWNLHPTTKSINSAKSNGLPVWNEYFRPLAELEYQSYCMTQQYDAIRSAFEKCKKKHLNSMTIEGRLYAPDLKEAEFQQRLSEIILPVYQSAKAAGFREWKYEKQAV